MLQQRLLERHEIAAVWSIDRSEVIDHIFVVRHGRLILQPAHFDMHGWPPGTAEQATPSLLDCFDHGGWCWGVFDGPRLAGVAVLESRCIGPQRDQLELKFLHVGHAYRGQGIGKRLFQTAASTAAAAGARSLYISATPSEHTVNFYLRQGCRLAAEPDPELFALEPEDIHLECKIAC